MRLDLITSDAKLRALEPAWNELWDRAAVPMPFQSAAWQLPWWECFGTGRPLIAAAWSGDRLCGLLTCYLLGEKLLPIGAGLSDYQDILLAADAPADTALRLLEKALAGGRQQGAAAFHLADLPSWAVLRSVPPPPGWRDDMAETDLCPVLPIPPGARDLRDVVPSGRARDFRQALHRAERRGGTEIAFADNAVIEDALAEAETLHGMRWRQRGESGVLADPRVRAFHRRAAPALLKRRLLRVAMLRIGGQPAAFCHALLGPGRLYLYLSGFDPRFAFESPGTILLGCLIGEAIRLDLREVHFLRGDEAYKLAWGGTPRRNAMRSFVPN